MSQGSTKGVPILISTTLTGAADTNVPSSSSIKAYVDAADALLAPKQSPTLIGPALGTPVSGVLTNCTGLPTAGLVNNAVTYAKIQQLGAYKALVNDTVAAADVTEGNWKSGSEAAYGGSITWTAGAAPSSTANLRQYFMQVGNTVNWQISLTYANAGTTVTQVLLTLPTEFPTPDIPTGFTGASVWLYPVKMNYISTPSGSALTNATSFIARNAADNGFVITQSTSLTSGTYRTFVFAGTYFTS